MKKVVRLDKSQLLGFRIGDQTKVGIKAGAKVGAKVGGKTS